MTRRLISVFFVLVTFLEVATAQTQSYIVKKRGSEVILDQSHALDLMIPASNAKLLTTRAVLSKYSLDHVWETEVFLNSAHEITISFAPDPLFTTETLYSLIDTLKAHYENPKKIFLDFSLITGGKAKEGVRAFEGEVSPYMFNFNSVQLVRGESSVISLPYITHLSVKPSDEVEDSMFVS